jgi:transcriptional regulator with XRE-family HTH domain
MARQALRQRRRQQGLTQEALAFAIGVATTTYREWERGMASPRVGFRPRLARQLDVSLAEMDRLLDGEGHTPVPDGLAVPAWLGHYAALEQGAAQIWSFEPVVVPGLLQTAAYATAIERVDPAAATEEAVRQKVDARLARQRVLTRQPDPLALSVVLDESVLHRIAGDRTVMAEQLGHLVDVTDRPTIKVRVLPFDAGVFSAAFGSFTVLTSPGSPCPYMACVEDRAGVHYLDRPHEIHAHIFLFEHLLRVALSPEDSVDMIRALAKENYA